MKILITGSTGMLGSSMIPVLRDEGHTVYPTDIVTEAGIDYLDVREYQQVLAYARKVQPDFIFHLAAETDLEVCEDKPQQAFLTNAVGTQNSALVCREMGIKMVYICTAGIFDGEKDSFYNEFDPAEPISVYGQSKLAGERLVKELLHEYFVFRPGWMIGGGKKDKKFVGHVLRQIADGASEIFAVTDKFGTPTYTYDLCRNIAAMIKTNFYGVYHSVCRGSASRYDVAKEIVRLLNRDDLTVHAVHSNYFAKDYPVPRPKSEMLVNLMLDARGMNLMRNWQEALADYIQMEHAHMIKGAPAARPVEVKPAATRKHVVILGAGLAGLACGYKLMQKGVMVTILEDEKEVGGLARTIKYKEYSFDFSAHRFASKNKVLIDEMKNIMGDNFEKCSKRSRILMWGRWLNYPFELGNLLLYMPKLLAVRAVLDYVYAQLKQKFSPIKIVSFKDWFIASFGNTLYKTNCLPYASKHWRVDPSQISSEWGDARSPGSFNLKTIIVDLLSKQKASKLEENNPYPDADSFYYPKHGAIAAISHRFADEIRARGGQISCGVKVKLVTSKENGAEIVYEDQGKERVIAADNVVSTIPLNLLVQILRPGVPVDVKNRLSQLKYLNTIFIDVIINKTHISDDSWLYFPQPAEEIIFNRAVEFKNWSRFMAPEDKTSLCLDISCMPDEPIWEEVDDKLIERVREGLLRAKIIDKPEEMEDGLVIKVPYTYPVYDLSYSENLKAVVDHVEDSGYLHVLGRTGKFRYYNMDDVVWAGFQLAGQLTGTDRLP